MNKRYIMSRLMVFAYMVLLAAGLQAASLTVKRLPTTEHADREGTTNTFFSTSVEPNFRRFRLELSFEATPSNNVEIAFGRNDIIADGSLDAEETDLIIGWDSGEWFLRPRGLKTRYTHVPTEVGAGARQRTLKLKIRSNTAGIATDVVFEDDSGKFTFEGFAANPVPVWLSPTGWDTMRAITRGKEIAEGSIKARFLADGAFIIIR